MSYPHRLTYAAAKGVWHVYNRGCVYVQSICEPYREISLFVFIPSRFCVECYFLHLRVWNCCTARGFPGDAAAYRVERAGLHDHTDSDSVAHADDYANTNRDTDSDSITDIDGHAVANTHIDTQPATIANIAAADIDSRDQ
jgi:hypothetical protein